MSSHDVRIVYPRPNTLHSLQTVILHLQRIKWHLLQLYSQTLLMIPGSVKWAQDGSKRQPQDNTLKQFSPPSTQNKQVKSHNRKWYILLLSSPVTRWDSINMMQHTSVLLSKNKKIHTLMYGKINMQTFFNIWNGTQKIWECSCSYVTDNC